MLGVAVVAAWRQRGIGPARPIATGLVASLLFTPYVGFQDFAMLVVAGWLLIRSGLTKVQVVLLVAGYALLGNVSPAPATAEIRIRTTAPELADVAAAAGAVSPSENAGSVRIASTEN